MVKQRARALQAHWYDKLKEDGFEDIEDEAGNLKCWHTSYFQCRYTPDTFIEKQQYYQMTKAFLVLHKFKTKKENRIWFLHSEGLSMRDIANELKINKDSIKIIIVRLTWLMRYGA